MDEKVLKTMKDAHVKKIQGKMAFCKTFFYSSCSKSFRGEEAA